MISKEVLYGFISFFKKHKVFSISLSFYLISLLFGGLESFIIFLIVSFPILFIIALIKPKAVFPFIPSISRKTAVLLLFGFLFTTFVIADNRGVFDSYESSSKKTSSVTKPSPTFTPTPSPTLTPTPIPSPTPEPTESLTPTPTVEVYRVKKVVDGDTIILENGEAVRYIGIDTPEVRARSKGGPECYALEAKEANKKLVSGKKVRLEKDVSERDRYGRLLRYVYVGDVFVNEYLVKEGYAKAVSYPPDVKYQDLFRKAERYAREHNKGLWSKNACVSPTPSLASLSAPKRIRILDCSLENKTAKISWSPVYGALSYALRVDNEENGWSGTCSWTNRGDYCVNNLKSTSYTIKFIPDSSYKIWVHAVGKSGWSKSAKLQIKSFKSYCSSSSKKSYGSNSYKKSSSKSSGGSSGYYIPKTSSNKSNTNQTTGSSGNFTCDCSKPCSRISSCAEAYFQLNQCGCSARDGDDDGVPCENLCD